MGKYIYKLVVALLLSVIILACSGNSATESDNGIESATDPLQGYNAYAVIEGVELGDGTVSLEDRYKEIPLNHTADSNLQVPLMAYATRGSGILEWTYLAIPVTNISNTAIESIKLENGYVLDDSGNPIHVNAIRTYLHGSVGKLSSTIFSDTCLAPGETGYFFMIIEDSWTGITSFEFSFDYSLTEPEETYARVIPQSYTFAGNDLTINFKNTGTRKIDLDSLVYFALLDSSDRIVDWSLITSNMVPVTGVLEIGETGSINDTYFSYGGTASKIIAFFNFDVFEESSSLSISRSAATAILPDVFMTHDEYVDFMVTQRFELLGHLRELSQ